MQLSKKQRELLGTIDKNLLRGDIKEIAARSGFTREYVGKCLNAEADFFNQKIVDEAVKVISLRDKYITDALENLATV